MAHFPFVKSDWQKNACLSLLVTSCFVCCLMSASVPIYKIGVISL